MKNLNNYIIEKLKLNKNIKTGIDIHDIEESIKNFSNRGMKYKTYFITEINDNKTISLKMTKKLSTTRDFDKLKAFGESIAFYLEDEFEIPVGLLDHASFTSSKLKQEKQKPLYVEWNYREELVKVTLNENNK